MNTTTANKSIATIDFDDPALQAMMRIAAKADPSRPHLQTINFDPADAGDVYATATDSYVMIRAKLPASIDVHGFERLSYSCDGLKQANQKKLGLVDLHDDAAMNGRCFSLPKSDCQINHASLFPGSTPAHKASVIVKDLERALQRVRISKQDDSIGIVFDDAKNAIELGLPAPGKMNVSLKKLQSVLTAFKHCYTVTFEAQEDMLRPLVLSNGTNDVQALVMPVRVRDTQDFTVTVRA